MNAKIKKHPLMSRLQRTFRRNAWHVEALEPRVLLSADPVLGALHGVLMPTADTQHTVPGAYEPAVAALPTVEASIDAAALIAAGVHQIGQHGSSQPIVLGSSGGAPVVVNGDLVLVSDGATGHITQDADLIVNGSLTVYGSGHTTVVAADVLQSGNYAINDSLRYSGARRVESTGGSLTLGGNNTHYLAGNSGSTTDTLTLRAANDITFKAAIATGNEGGDLLNSLVIESAADVTFERAVTISGNLSINATGTVTFQNSVTLAAGGSLTITGAAHLVFQLNTVELTGGGNILLQADDISTSALGDRQISGSGSVTIRPNTVSASMSVFDVRGAPGTLDLSSDDLRPFRAGFSSFTFGWQDGVNPAARPGSGPVVLGGSNVELLANPVRVFGSAISVIDMIAGDKTLRIGGGSDLSLIAIGDIDIQNEIEAANLNLTSATGHILGSNYIPNSGSSDLIQAEPIRVDHLVALAATGVTLPNLQIHSLDVQNSGGGAIAVGIDAARFVGDSFDGNVTVQRLAQTATSGSNDISLTTRAGSITVAAGVGISVGGSGALSLSAQGAGSDIQLNAPITVQGGAVSLSAADAITSAATGTITATGASAVVLTAIAGGLSLGGAITTVGGSLSLNSGAGLDLSGITLDAGPSGVISLTSVGDLKVGRITAASAIGLSSSTGAILDALVGNVANLSGESAAVSLSAATGIGTAAAPLRTAIGTLTANVSAGGLFIAEDSGLAIAAGGLSTAGAIVVRNALGALDVNGAVHSAAAGGHILLESVTGDLNVRANVVAELGSISLAAAQALMLSGAAAIEVRSRAANETLDLRAGGALTMAADALLASANGGQRLDAGGALVVGRIDAGIGPVSLRAATAISGVVGAPVRNDIMAGALRLQALGGSIGAPTDALAIQVMSLAAASSSGAIYLVEADGLAIGSVAGVAAKRVAADGSATALASDPALVGLLANSHVILQSMGTGAMNLAAGAAVAAGGNVLLSAGGALGLAGPVSSTGGAVSLLAGGAITHAAAALVSSGGGAVDEHAGGALSYASGSSLSTGGGRLRLQAAGALTLGAVDAGTAEAWVSAASIGTAAGINAGNGGVDLRAGALRLLATGSGVNDGVGTASDALALQVQSLALAASGGGGVFVSEADDLSVAPVTGFAGARVMADGSVGSLAVDASLAGLSSAAATLVLSAGGSMSVASAVPLLATRLRLSAGIDMGLASAATASASALSLSAGRDLLLSAHVSAGGGKGLEMTAGRDLSMTAGIKASATGVSALQAGRQLSVAEVDVGTAALALSAGSGLFDVDSSGDSTVNVRAGGLVLTAGTGIGVAGNALETAVTTLAATGGSGGVFITESDALSVGTVMLNADRVNADGSLGSAPAQSGLGLTADGAVVLSLGAGNLSVDRAVTATGGNVRLTAPGSISFNAAVSGVNLTVIAGADVTQSAAGDLNATLAASLSAGAAWTMSDGAEITSTSNGVRLSAVGLLTVGKIGAGSDSLSLVAGAIKDITGEVDATGPDLIAGILRLQTTGTTAADGIGSSGEALDIAASSLAVGVPGGSVFLAQTGASLTVASLGPVVDRPVGVDGGLQAAVNADASLAGITGSGSVVLRAASDLNITAAIRTGGTILLSSAGGLALSADVISSAAAVSLSAAQDMSVAGAALASQGAGRSLDIQAGRDLLLLTGSSVSTNNGAIAVQSGNAAFIRNIDAGSANVAVLAGTGSINDGEVTGGTAVDIRAGGLLLRTGSGNDRSAIGSAANAIETSVTSLSAAGLSLSVTETQGLRIDRVAVAVQRVGNDGSTTTLDLGAQEDLLIGQNIQLTVLTGDLVVAGGTASAATAISAGGSVLLRAVSGNLSLNAALSAGGATSLRASGDLGFAAAGSVSLAGASTLDAEAGASITMVDGTVFSSASGALRLAAALNMSLGSLATGGDVSLTARNITDAGGAEVDVNARGLRVVTVGAGTTQGFGTAAAPIQTQVTTLAADVAGTGAGGLFVREVDGLLIDTVGPVVVQRVGSDGLRTDVADAALSDLVSAGNVVLISAAGDVSINDGGNSDGRGLQAGANVLIDSAGDLNLSGALRSAAGNISLLAAGAINDGAEVAIARTGRTIDVQAGGAVSQGAAGVLATVDAAIRVQAGGSIAVASITAGRGNVSLISLGGSIAEAGSDAAADVVAAGLRLASAVGIGSAAERLDTAVSTVSARAGSGGIWLQEADAVRVGDVAVSVKRVSTAATTADDITDATQSDLITSNNGSIALLTLNGSIVFSDGTAPSDNSSIHADGTGTVSLQATGAEATVDLSNQGIAQQGNVVVDSAVSLQGPLVINAGQGAALGDGAITITGAVDGQAGGAVDTLTLHADGAVRVMGAIGSRQALAGLVVDGATDVSFDQAVTLTGDLLINATGNVQFLGALQLNGGSLTILGASSLLLGDVVIASGQGVIRVDALTLAGILSGSSAASLEVAGATAGSAVSIGTGTGTGASLNLGLAQLAGIQGFGSVILGRTDQGATSVDVATLATLATPNLTLAGRSVSVQGSAASALTTVQVLTLNTAQDLTLAGRLALSTASADVQANVGAALVMASDGQIVTQAGDVRLQTVGDLVIGRIDSRAGTLAGAVAIASTSGTIREANADSSTDIYADLLTLRGRGPLLLAGDSTVPSALDVSAKVLDIDAPTGIILRDSGADGRTRFNLLDGTVLRQQVVADAATPRQASASAVPGGINAAGAPDAWSWLAAAHPLQDSRDTGMAMMLMTSPVLSSRIAELPSHWSGLEALFSGGPMLGALAAHREATHADAEAWNEALVL